MSFKLLKKMSTAVRGLATEVGEDIVDSQGIRIFEQELVDAKEQLAKAKTSLTELIGKKKIQENEVNRLKKDIKKYLNAAKEAKEEDNQGLAKECVERVIQLEEELEGPKTLVKEFSDHAKRLTDSVNQTEKRLKSLQRQIDNVKATEQVQKARAAVASQYSGTSSDLGSAAESLERIKKRQAEKSAQFDAAQELADNGSDDLDAKLKKANIGSNKKSVEDILAGL